RPEGARPQRLNRGAVESYRHEYCLRNQRDQKYLIEAEATGSGLEGCVVKALITAPDGRTFRYEVRCGGAVASTEPALSEVRYLHTSLTFVRGQTESRMRQVSAIRVFSASGLLHTEIGVALG